MSESKQRYFACKHGHVVRRWGTASYIGSVRTSQGYQWTDGEVVAIPEIEFNKYVREYSRCIKDGSLIEKTKKDWDDFVKEQAFQSAKDSKKKLTIAGDNETVDDELIDKKKNRK